MSPKARAQRSQVWAKFSPGSMDASGSTRRRAEIIAGSDQLVMQGEIGLGKLLQDDVGFVQETARRTATLEVDARDRLAPLLGGPDIVEGIVVDIADDEVRIAAVINAEI